MAAHSAKKTLNSVGHYDLLGVVAVGGMGTVYKARDRRSGEFVAVKVLKLELDLSDEPQVLARFVQEFRAAAKLEHPNIVRAIDFGSEGPLNYLVTEFVEGEDLSDLIGKHGRLPEEEAVRIITQAAQALHYAHEARVIHRDVKPENILVRADGVVKLADFGLAKDWEEGMDLTRTSRGLGTPHFMAPEQYADAKNAGVACDVYSLGATLYTAVTGQIPFDGCASLVALAQKVKGDIPSPRQLVPTLKPWVDRAIRQAMDPNPARRPESCLAFFKLLTACPRRTARSGPRAARSGLPADRRVWVRHPLTLGTTCKVDTGVHPETGNEESWPLIVRDVSAGGLGLLLARRFEVGTRLSIEFTATSTASPRRLEVRIVRVRAEEFGHWEHGCTVDGLLGERDLAILLGELAAAAVTPVPAQN